jgi:hypothetical protein
LKDLFVSPIFPTTWDKIGKSDADEWRRTVENKLTSVALEFAIRNGKYSEMKAELSKRTHTPPSTLLFRWKYTV